MTKKNDFDAVSPILRDVLGVNETNDAPVSGDTPQDPIGALIERTRYGLPAPVAPNDPLKKTPLTLEQTKAALSAMAEQVSDVRRRKIVEEVFPRMLVQSEELYGETLTTRFLRAAVTKDRDAMRQVIKEMDAPFVPEPEPEIKSSEENENE